MAEKKERIEETVVISTRIRFARNFAAYPFPKKMDDAQAADIVYLVEKGLQGLGDDYRRYDIGKMSKDDAIWLQEQHLISPALSRSKRGAAFVSADKCLSIMVNEEDHLREQYFYKGFELYRAYERISAVDDGLSANFDFAFDEKWGYLTACPSNLGTGMRASIMVFLPGLARSGGLKELLPELKARGITVRGAFGEGTSAEGYVYQISNELTLGMSEADILRDMVGTAHKISEMELRARDDMLIASEKEIRDRCLRAYGTLTHCAILGMKEFLSKIADVKLGVVLGFFETDDLSELDNFSEDMRPISLCRNNGLPKLSEKECDEVRAETVVAALPELVRIVKGTRKARR